jgi:hypothetical protein
VALGLTEPNIPDHELTCSTVPALCETNSARELLSIVWQVEGAALALTFAAALFAFESAARQRTSLSLHDYAERTGLLQFVMLGASGLIVVGVVLGWDSGRPPVAASTFALGVAAFGISMFPVFVRRAIDVVGPAWFRRERLKDIQRAVEAHVYTEALAMASVLELDTWLKGRSAVQRAPWAPPDHVPLEGGGAGTVFDLDLDCVETLEPDVSDLLILTHIGAPASTSTAFLAARETAGHKRRRAATTVVRDSGKDLLSPQVNALHEEALEAIRSGSPSAAEEVAEGYAELLLAWPRTWGKLGQRVQGGILTALHPFSIGPVDEVQRHLWLQLEQAIERGLRQHVTTITSIPWLVAREVSTSERMI